MNAKLATLTLAAALFASSGAFAAQPHGRDTVYAGPGSALPSAKVARTHEGNGRGSVYARDLPAPASNTAVGQIQPRFGRA